MKRLLLSTILIASTMTMASDYIYEATPLIGYNQADADLNIKNTFLLGKEFQIDIDTFFVPEFSVLYTDTDYEDLESNSKVEILRLALNGVHDFDSIDVLTPLAKIGFGFEKISGNIALKKDSWFVDAGVGVKVRLDNAIAFKAEAVYMIKKNNNRWDKNLAFLAGITFAFGENTQKEVDTQFSQENVIKEVDTQDSQENVIKEVDTQDSQTNIIQEVDTEVSQTNDNSGVNSLDKYPKTPTKNVVKAKSAAQILELYIQFENNSFNVDEKSKTQVQAFADFLKIRKNFSTKIIGHTSSPGTHKYNQELSVKRATTVKDILVKDGVEANRIEAIGRGEDELIVQGNDAKANRQNRRVQALLIEH